MYRLLEESFREEPFVTFGLAIFACYLALIAINFVYLYYVYYFPSFCFYAFLALVAFISFSSCCNSLRTFIVGQCLSLGPFSVSPLPPCSDFAFVAPRHVEVSRLRRVLCEPPVMGKNREEEKSAIPYFKWNNNAVRRRDKGSLPFRSFFESDPIDVLGVDVEVYSWADIRRGINDFYRRQNDDRKKSHSKNTSPTVLPDAVDLLCEQFAAMDLGPSAQASASVQHQDEPAFPMLVDAICDDVVQSWEDEADADSLALTDAFSSSSAGTPFPDCDVEMEDSFEDDSNEIPSAAAGEIGPVAMDIDGDSLSMDNHVQEQEQQQQQQQQESSVDFIVTDAMDTAAELAFMSPAQEQSIPDGRTPVVGTVADSDDFSPEVIADTAAVETAEHVQDVGESTASIDALALAILANMLPPLEQSNIITDGYASLADVSLDFPAMTNAATLVEESNGEEVRVGVDELVEREAPSAMQTAAELAFMPPAQEQSMPEEYTPVFSTDDYSDIIAAAVAVENSEHVQDVGDSTALYNALALAMTANMLPSLDESNITTDGQASSVDVFSDFPTLTNAASLVEVFNDEEVRVGVDELAEGEASVLNPADDEDCVGVDGPVMNDVEASVFPPPQATRSPAEDMFSEFLVEYDDGDYEYWG